MRRLVQYHPVNSNSRVSNNTTLHFEKFFQIISQKYVLLNRFFTLIPEMTAKIPSQ
jgi:hypothetical protein